MLRVLFVMAAFAGALQARCIAIEGAQITAGDLATAAAEFGKLDRALVFSFGPVLGSQRTISAAELEKWAADHGLGKISVSSVCFERAGYELAPDDVIKALASVFGSGIHDLHIEVVDLCRCQLPVGRLEFSLSGASLPPIDHPEMPVLWRGRLIDSDEHSYPVWVRARITANITVVRAAVNLRPSQILSREELEEANISSSPLRFRRDDTLTAYEGASTNVSVARGTILRGELVHRPSDVERGSLVKVEVVNGGAKLVLTARAETAGNKGDVITLTNPTGAARFRASVTGPARAEISLPPERLQTVSTNRELRAGNSVAGRSF
jgi:flagella basal body P-ring formation protein FlgA